MAKAKKRSADRNWTSDDHDKRLKNKSEESSRRTAVLTHGTDEKKDAMRLKLHIAKCKRELARLKEHIQSYDPEEEKMQPAIEEAPKKKGRKGPETWKLRGAARPAHEVYDFDVRYVDPHAEAHKKADIKFQRSQNLLHLHRGNFGSSEIPGVCHDYLANLCQLASLSVEAHQFKTARECWLECIELEGDYPITMARDHLMLMYMHLRRYESAIRLGDRLEDDNSTVVRYSVALASLVEGKEESEAHTVRAIRSNPLCAYYLAFGDIFAQCMEYTDDLVDSDDLPESSLEEAIQYCSGEGVMGIWTSIGGRALLRNLLHAAQEGKRKDLSPEMVDWDDRLRKIEAELNNQAADRLEQVQMFMGMYRTAMEMAADSESE